MDAVQKEGADESLESETILVPPEIAKAFGRGLRQKIFSRWTAIGFSTASLNVYPSKKKAVISIYNQLQKTLDILNGLEKAKEVKILVREEGGNDFLFSRGTEEVMPSTTPGEVLMDPDMTREFTKALSHTLLNPLFIISGRAENTETQEEKIIYNASNEIAQVVKSLREAHQLKMTTNSEGNTTIIPIRQTKDINY